MDLKRKNQRKQTMWKYVQSSFLLHLTHHPHFKDILPNLEEQVIQSQLSPFEAAEKMLEASLKFYKK